MSWPFIWTVGFLACGSAEETKECSAITETIKKDECYHNELLQFSSAELPQIISHAKQITDPLIRGAAVSSWVRDHNNEITQKQGMDLCALLDGRDRFYCMRRLSSPHLKR